MQGKPKFFVRILTGIASLLLVVTLAYAPISSTTPPAKAGLPVMDWIAIGLEISWDFLEKMAFSIAKNYVQRQTKELVRWISDGYDGSPAFSLNLKDDLASAADATAGAMLTQALGTEFFCSPFRIELGSILQMRYFSSSGDYFSGQGCTLSQIAGNVENFIGGGNWSEGGWGMWHRMTLNPHDNIYGSYFSASSELSLRVTNAKGETLTQLNWGGGVHSWCEPDTDSKQVEQVISCSRDTNGNGRADADETPVVPVADIGGTRVALTPGNAGKCTSTNDNRFCNHDTLGFVERTTSGGFIPLVCKSAPTSSAASAPVCVDKEGNPKKVSTPGSVVADTLKFNANSSLRQLELADSIDQVIAAVLQRGFVDVKNLLGGSKPKSGGRTGSPPTTVNVTGLDATKAKDELIRATDEQIASVKEFLTNVKRIQKQALKAANYILSFSTSEKRRRWGRTNYVWLSHFSFTEDDLAPKEGDPDQLFAFKVFDEYGNPTSATTSILANLKDRTLGKGRPMGDFCSPAVGLAFMYDIQPTLQEVGGQIPRAETAIAQLFLFREEIVLVHRAAMAGERAISNLDLLEVELGGGITREEVETINDQIAKTLTTDEWQRLADRYYSSSSTSQVVADVQTGALWEKMARKYESIVREPYMPASNEISSAIQDSIDQRTEGSYTTYGLMSYYIDISTRDYGGKACGKMVDNPDAIARIIEDNNLAAQVSAEMQSLLAEAAAESAEGGDEQDTTTILGNPSVSIQINGNEVVPDDPDTDKSGPLTATASSMLLGETFSFGWSSRNTTYCKITAPNPLTNNGSAWPVLQTDATSGNVTLRTASPAGAVVPSSYEITVTCYKDASTYDQFIVTIPMIQPRPELLVNGSANTTPTLSFGSTFTFTWNASGATSCRAEGSRVPQAGNPSQAWPTGGSLATSGSIALLAKDFGSENAPFMLDLGMTCTGPAGSASNVIVPSILP